MELLEAVVLFGAVAVIYVLLCAGERIAKWLMPKFDWLATYFTEPDDPEDDELIDYIRNLREKP